MAWTLSEVATFAWTGLNDVPTAISGQVMEDLALQSVFFTNNYLKTSISGNSINDTYFSPIVNLTKAWTLARMANVGVQYSFHLGEFSVDKGANSNTEAVQVKTFFDMALLELQQIPKPLLFAKANG